jgi:DNA invertase Pin-like site-specific DNA recombinase
VKSLTTEEIKWLRTCAEAANDWAEAARLTADLADRCAAAAPQGSPAEPIDPYSGERNPNAKLNRAAVRAIRKAYGNGERPSVLARAFGVAPQTVRNVGRGVTWREAG